MTPKYYRDLLDHLESMAMRAKEHCPRNSFYYRWILRTIGNQELPVIYFLKLYRKLSHFHKETI